MREKEEIEAVEAKERLERLEQMMMKSAEKYEQNIQEKTQNLHTKMAHVIYLEFPGLT